MKKIILSLFVAFVTTLSFAQEGLETVIVEEIDASSVMAGATTYRVFVDLEAGYELQLLKGDEICDLSFNTTGTWFNTNLGGTASNNIFSALFAGFPELIYDSYLSLGGVASTNEWGVLYADDSDGTVDGWMAFSATPTVTFVSGDIAASAAANFGTDATATNLLENMSGSYTTLTSNGDIAPNNRIFIGQFTTDGEFSFALNVQVNEIGETNAQVHTACDFPILNYPAPILGCMDDNACNFDGDVTLDDGSCLYIDDACNDNNDNTVNDVIDANCMCVGVPIVMGCTDETACNYNADANVDDGTCLIEGAACDDGDANTTNDVVDENCNCAGEPIVMGCTNLDACNLDPLANVDDGSCLFIGAACDDGNENTVNDMITADCICEGVTGIDDIIENNNDLMIYPNPAQDQLFIDFDLVEAEQIRFEIFDISGKAINSFVSTLSIGEVTHTLNTEYLEAGMYLLRISNEGESATFRFSIVR